MDVSPLQHVLMLHSNVLVRFLFRQLQHFHHNIMLFTASDSTEPRLNLFHSSENKGGKAPQEPQKSFEKQSETSKTEIKTSILSLISAVRGTNQAASTATPLVSHRIEGKYK